MWRRARGLRRRGPGPRAGVVACVRGGCLAALRKWASRYEVLRETFGGVLLLGLESWAADLIRTVAVAPTLENVGVLGLIVLIRTFLSFSLEIEIEGVPPWRRALVSGTSRIARGCQPGPSRDGRVSGGRCWVSRCGAAGPDEHVDHPVTAKAGPA